MLAKPILLPKVDACGSARREKGDAVRSPDGVVRAESRAGDRDGRESRSVMGSRVAPSEPRIHESSAPTSFFFQRAQIRPRQMRLVARRRFQRLSLVRAPPSFTSRRATRSTRAFAPRALAPRPPAIHDVDGGPPPPPSRARLRLRPRPRARDAFSSHRNGCASSVAPHLLLPLRSGLVLVLVPVPPAATCRVPWTSPTRVPRASPPGGDAAPPAPGRVGF